MKNKISSNILTCVILAGLSLAEAQTKSPSYNSNSGGYKYNQPTYGSKPPASSGSNNRSSSSSSPSYSGGSSGSYKQNEPTYRPPAKPSTPSYTAPKNDYVAPKKSTTPSTPSYSGGSGYTYKEPTYNAPKPSTPSYTAPKNDYVAPKKSTTPSTPSYSGGSGYTYKEPTYNAPKKPSTPSYTAPKNDYVAPKKTTPPRTPSYSGGSGYTYNEPTYNAPSKPSTPAYTAPKNDYVAPKKKNTPSYGGNSGSYTYNEPTFNAPARPSNPSYTAPKQNGSSNYGNSNSGNYSNNRPGTNKNGTVLLKDLRPGEGRTRADGSTDKVHKDGKGYTHTFVDKNGSIRKESIRFDNNGREVKISDTERRPNGDIITKYKSGATQYQTKDGLKYQQDRYGKTVYQESKSTWNNRPVIYRQYNNNYTTVYVQNIYYGTPSYFYRPTYFDYDYYSYSLTSWSRPVYYSWQWNYHSWYSSYYRPYVTYYSPAYWLTDYLLMALIQSNYDRIAADNEVMAQQSQYNQIAMSEQIKEEVRRQVEQALRQQQQAVQTQSVMDPSQILTQGRLMIVHTDLNVEDQEGSQCQLDEGDVIRLLNQPSAQNPIVQLTVVSAKGTSCPVGTTLQMSANNLIEMESEFQARIQQGMTEMKSGKVGVN